MESRKIVQYLDEYLKIKEISDESINGLQIDGKAHFAKIALAVDFSLQAAVTARFMGADLLIVHHGLIWGGLKSITGVAYNRIKFMLDSAIALYAAHLPLDMHPEIGHNVELVRLLNVTNILPFGDYKGKALGFCGTFPKPLPLEAIKRRIDETLGISSTILPFGKESVKSIGIISGGGSKAISEAIEKKLDLFLTGEASHTIYHVAKDAVINVIYAGHYATETVGLKALGRHLEAKFGIPVDWIEAPTGL